MKRIALSLGFFAAALMVFMQLISPGSAGATTNMTSTPAAGEVQKTTLGQTGSASAPGRTLILQQRTFAPGSDSGAHPAPGPVVLFVQSGSITFRVDEGAAIVTRATGEQQQVMAGQTVTLNEYDVVTYDEGVVHDVANPGSEPAVTLESRLNPTESPATPAA
jgi:quercetin dioxygenase-like cupin family protein